MNFLVSSDLQVLKGGGWTIRAAIGVWASRTGSASLSLTERYVGFRCAIRCRNPR